MAGKRFAGKVQLHADRVDRFGSRAVVRNATIIEDDYDAEFRYDREPVGTLQGLAPDRVVLLGKVSSVPRTARSPVPGFYPLTDAGVT
jgi:hypothetical protein